MKNEGIKNLTELRLTTCCSGAAEATAVTPELPTAEETVAGMMRGGAETVLEVAAVGPEDTVCSICSM